jgi:hypothetical protein
MRLLARACTGSDVKTCKDMHPCTHRSEQQRMLQQPTAAVGAATRCSSCNIITSRSNSSSALRLLSTGLQEFTAKVQHNPREAVASVPLSMHVDPKACLLTARRCIVTTTCTTIEKHLPRRSRAHALKQFNRSACGNCPRNVRSSQAVTPPAVSHASRPRFTSSTLPRSNGSVSSTHEP